jgi:outer membrane immunogenic protein
MARKNFRLLTTVAPLAIALGGFALGGPALGADLYTKAPYVKAPVATPYSWTGWYIGANAGYGVGQGQAAYAYNIPGLGAGTEPFNGMPAGGFAGGQLGYNYQINNIVLGIETDMQGSGISDTRTCMLLCAGGNAAMIDEKLKWFGTTRARLGWASGPVLTYVTGGAAYGETETGLTTTVAGGGASSVVNSTTKTGWTWGTGVEAALGGNWTAKAEYLYINLGSGAAANGPPGLAGFANFNTRQQEQLFSGGINYHFGPDQSAALVPTANWGGAFVGGTFGFGIGRNDSTFATAGVAAEAFTLSPRGFDGGGIVGYNWQFGRWVIGAEADIQDSTGSGYLTCVVLCNTTTAATTIDQKLSWFGTVRGRLGYTVGPALFYATGGAAYGSVKESMTETAPGGPPVGVSASHSKSGFAVGGGIENKLDLFGLLGPNWSTRTEYLYVDLGSVTDTLVNPAVLAGTPQTLTSNVHEHIWRTVVSYKFGG